jgi:hypothetical protein
MSHSASNKQQALHMHSGGTVRDVTLSLLRQAGMTTIFGNPGSTELPFFSEFPGDFRYVLGLQESVVVGMADGFAQATRNPAMVNLHSAAGVGHALGNIFTAFKNQTPACHHRGPASAVDPALRAIPIRRTRNRIPAPIHHMGD